MGMWMGGKRKEVGGWGRNFCSRWYRDTKQSTYTCMCVRVCVFMGRVSSCCLIFLRWGFLTILRNNL